MKPIKAAIISVAGTCLTDEEKRLLEKENPLGVSLFARNVENAEQLKALTSAIRHAVGRNDILIATDQEGGRVCRLKEPNFGHYASQAALGSLPIEKAQRAVYLHAKLIANDLHKCGINCNFAPVLDIIFPEMTKALKSRCFSSDADIVTNLGKILLDTYIQNAVLPCVKHIPGHGDCGEDPHLSLPVLNHIDERSFYPFINLAPQALMAMTAHVVLPEIDTLPATQSRKIIQLIIRRALNFQGILISDTLEMKALKGTLAERTRQSIKARCDAVCYSLGQIEDCRSVLENCGYLNDRACSVWEKISKLISTPYSVVSLQAERNEYDTLTAQANEPDDDYDAVEVLNQLCAK